MLTLKRRCRRRVPPQRGRGAILGLFFCCAQCSIPVAEVSTGPALATAHSFARGFAATREIVPFRWGNTTATQAASCRTSDV